MSLFLVLISIGTTLESHHIAHAFEKAGLWPIQEKKVQSKLQEILNRRAKETIQADKLELELPCLPQPSTPKTYNEYTKESDYLHKKALDVFSSPSARRLSSYINGGEAMVLQSQLINEEINFSTQASEKRRLAQNKSRARKQVQRGGMLSVGHARKLIASKIKNEAETQRKALDRKLKN